MKPTKEINLISETMPHVAKNIDLFWGTEYLPDYINTLILDTRDGTRTGFPKKIAKILYDLLETHNVKYPPKAKKPSIWDDAHKI